MAFAMSYPVIASRWYTESNNLVVLQVPSEECLKHLATKAEDAGIKYIVFREPDFENTVTTVTIESLGKRLVSNLPLALRATPRAT